MGLPPRQTSVFLTEGKLDDDEIGEGWDNEMLNRSDCNGIVCAWTKDSRQSQWRTENVPAKSQLWCWVRKAKCLGVFQLVKLKPSLLALNYSTFQKRYSQSFRWNPYNTVPWDILVKKAKEVLERAYASKMAAALWRAPAGRGWITERRLCPRTHSFCPRGAKNVKEQGNMSQ